MGSQDCLLSVKTLCDLFRYGYMYDLSPCIKWVASVFPVVLPRGERVNITI